MRKIITITIDDERTGEQIRDSLHIILENSETYSGYITTKDKTFKLESKQDGKI